MSLHHLVEVRRALRAALPGVAGGLEDASEPLERTALASEPPRMKATPLLEGDRLRAHPLRGGPEVVFAAFLDGVQESRAAMYADGVPIVHGRVGAVIRAREERRLTTWIRPLMQSSLYAPRRLLSPAVWSAIRGLDLTTVDTGVDEGLPEVAHPYELVRRAIHAVQRDRERLERELAERWCAAARSPLYVDGGLPRGERSATSPWCVGVVKSHHTLYAADAGLRTVLALPEGSRSSVFHVEPSWGSSVASWYLRLRDPQGRDPMWGLVRVEIALTPDLTTSQVLSARAEQVSRWIMAERSPLSLPDSRWPGLAYGIRDCEEYLRAVSG
jgi:hypothetical protein